MTGPYGHRTTQRPVRRRHKCWLTAVRALLALDAELEAGVDPRAASVLDAAAARLAARTHLLADVAAWGSK